MNKTNVLVIGSGGREHALLWKLQQSKHVHEAFCAPGNGGIPNSLPILTSDFDRLVAFARKNHCFTIVGPEEPLAQGIVDRFRKEGLGIYGVTREAAMAECSKIWARHFMKTNNIPQPVFEIFGDAAAARDFVKKRPHPVVIKADGLAAGKGVAVCYTPEAAVETIEEMMIRRKFGSSGERILVEEMLLGEEASYMVIIDTDAGHFIPLATSQDHKPVLDGDQGPNTGGMGAYSPAPVIDEEIQDKIRREIVKKFIDGMRSANIEFKGTLYLGLMISEKVPYVLEFNVRFGDPEAQPIVMRMKSDLFEYLKACADGRLTEMDDFEWATEAAVCVVMASQGYPGQYERGKVITGLDEATQSTNVAIFHSGTSRQGSDVVTNGGRVLGVTSLGRVIPEAIEEAYRAVNLIHWKGEYHRKDIGRKALKHIHAA